MVAPRVKNLEFTDTDVIILATDKMARILVKWKIKKTTQDLSNVFFDVYRGESPTEMVKVNTHKLESNQIYEYTDDTVILRSINKNYYYKVVAVDYFNGTPVQNFESQTTTWQGKLDLVGLYIVEEHLFAFRYLYGTPGMLFKKKSEGVRCNVCWDNVIKRITKSNCTSCFGTGFTGGYYKSSSHWMNFSPDPTSAQVTEFGVREPSQNDVQFVNYPLLQMGDIILEVEPFRFWRVIGVSGAEKNRNTLLQVARLDEINKADIEQQVQVNSVERMKLLAELNERGNETEF